MEAGCIGTVRGYDHTDTSAEMAITGPDVSTETELRIVRLFPPEELADVRRILRDECGHNLPFCENSDSTRMERVRFAVLKLSEGNRYKLLRAVQLAQRDWRDLLVAAGFANDVQAHKSWLPGKHASD